MLNYIENNNNFIFNILFMVDSAITISLFVIIYPSLTINSIIFLKNFCIIKNIYIDIYDLSFVII